MCGCNGKTQVDLWLARELDGMSKVLERTGKPRHGQEGYVRFVGRKKELCCTLVLFHRDKEIEKVNGPMAYRSTR